MQTTRTQRALLSAAALLLFATTTLAFSDQPTTPSDTSHLNNFPLRQPDRTLTITGSEYIDILDISPDGQTAFSYDTYDTIHLWNLLTYDWRYTFAIPPIISILAGLFFIKRALRRRKWGTGEPYCKKCHYQLTGNTTGQCPECGQTITPKSTLIGKPFKRQLITITTICLILPVTYCLTLWCNGTSNNSKRSIFGDEANNSIDAYLFDRFDWYSQSLFKLNKWLNIEYLQGYETYVDHVRTMDLATGKFGQTLHKSDLLMPHASISPDGQSIVITNEITATLWNQISKKRITRLDARTKINAERLGGDIFGKNSYIFWKDNDTLYIGNKPTVEFDFDSKSVSLHEQWPDINKINLGNDSEFGPASYANQNGRIISSHDMKTIGIYENTPVSENEQPNLLNTINLPYEFHADEIHLSHNQRWIAAVSNFSSGSLKDTYAILIDVEKQKVASQFKIDIEQEINIRMLRVSNNGTISIIFNYWNEEVSDSVITILQFNPQP